MPPPGLARCRKCGLLPEDEFYPDSLRHGKGRSSECKTCFRARADTLPAKPRDYRASNLRRSFGITVEQYEAMFEAQGGLCAICGQSETDVHHATGQIQRLAVDHDRNTKVIRGLLCGRCNKGIGSLQHSEAILLAAIAYLRGTAC